MDGKLDRSQNVRRKDKTTISRALLLLCLLLPRISVGQTDLGVEVTTGGYFWDLMATSNGGRVIYDANLEDSGIQDLYSITTSGSGSNTKLNGTIASGGSGMYQFEISPDDQWVVYRADEDNNWDPELFSVPTEGGTPSKLNVALSAGQEIKYFQITSDSDSVVYRGDQDTAGQLELYAAPIDGSAGATKLNPALDTGEDVNDFDVSPDGSTVVYIADLDVDGESEVYSVPITGGTSTQLNDPLVSGGSTSTLQISPNGDSVVWVGDHDTDGIFEIYAVPIEGGTVQKLNDALPAAADVNGTFYLANDGTTTWVVYLADRDTDGQEELYSVPIIGGTVQELNGTMVTGGKIVTVRISPDASTVVYNADQDVLNKIELYSVSIAGGTPVKINSTTMIAGGDIYGSRFAINSSNDRIVYLADQDTDGTVEAYSSPIGGGVPIKISTARTSGIGVRQMEVSPDGNYVAYRGEMNGNNIYELYEVGITGGVSVKQHSDLSGSSDVDDFIYTPTGNIVFTVDMDGNSYDELFIVSAEILPVEMTSFEARRTGPEHVQVAWSTAQETDNEGFLVEMSLDGTVFEGVGFVAGAGDSEQPLHYRYEALTSQSAYFRLRQQDFDGDAAYSEVVFVPGITGELQISVGPNPTAGVVRIYNSANQPNREYFLQLYTSTGSTLLSANGHLSTLTEDLNNALTHLPAGIYSLRLGTGGQEYFQRLVVQ